MFDQYVTQLLHSTTTKSHLPPIQRGRHHVFSPEHTTRDILSFMAQVQGLKMPKEQIGWWSCQVLDRAGSVCARCSRNCMCKLEPAKSGGSLDTSLEYYAREWRSSLRSVRSPYYFYANSQLNG
ncbi:hypothetical protein XENOCAPTIV_020913 [Xenoophorus captivus]|uniref:Uncharacterized protein n=1 Tax=Xenoophorus captivus TaxID=1517983 RepID=A0ABV0SIF1_9TELE